MSHRQQRTLPLILLQPLLLALLILPVTVDGRRTRGSFQLSGVNTEHIISSFAVGTQGGRMTLRLGCDDPYPDETHIKLRVYEDTDWKAYRKALVCTDKIKLAKKTIDLRFSFKGDGPLAPRGGKWQAVKTIMLSDPTVEGEAITSPHYYYFVVDDCSLEQVLQDQQIPRLTYEINTWNYYGNPKKRRSTQLGSDEDYLLEVHELSLIASLAILAWLSFNIVMRFFRKKNANTVHVSLLWITIAAALDFGSSMCELFHLEVYHYNGAGNYFLDSLSTHMEAMCDGLIMLFLLSIGAGWTLPTDVVGINPTAASLQATVSKIATPFLSALKSSRYIIPGVAFLALQALLAQLGRTYNDDFDSYHDYAHWPGHVLIAIRIFLGVIFLSTTLQTRIHCRVEQLKTFYFVLAALGFAWFELLPLLTFICNWVLPFHVRKPAVYMGNAILQSSCIVLSSWLVTSHATAYHTYSHMSNNEGPSLTETLAGGSQHSREVKLFGKAKVRFD